MNFSALIKSKREALGMTLQEVADAAGISKSHLHGLENEAHPNPGLYTCVRLAVALELPLRAMGSAILERDVQP